MTRRRLIGALAAAAAAMTGRAASAPSSHAVFTVYTFGDSILDCARYNAHGLHPGQLIVRNDDRLFPTFRGRDLLSLGPATLVHRAVDGARVDDLPRQIHGIGASRRGVALITIGGNDLLAGLAADRGAGIGRFESQLEAFVRKLPIRPVLVGNVYDPTFGDDARNFLGIDASIVRANFDRVNAAIASVAAKHGTLVDIHAHFRRGDLTWFTRTIEPSLRGASEVRAVFLPDVMRVRGA